MTWQAFQAFHSQKETLHAEGFPPLTVEEQHQFDQFFHGCYQKVYHLAYRLSGNRSDAEDLTQEAFLKAYKHFKEYEGEKPFENWIYRILTHLFVDQIRTKQRRVHTVSMDAPINPERSKGSEVKIDFPDTHQDPEKILLNQTVSEEIEGSLAKLKTSQRLLVFLADIEELSYHDIAEIVGIPVGTVRSRLHRAHKLLRASLQ